MLRTRYQAINIYCSQTPTLCRPFRGLGSRLIALREGNYGIEEGVGTGQSGQRMEITLSEHQKGASYTLLHGILVSIWPVRVSFRY